MTDNVTHLPEPGVILDLDSVERDQSDVKEPFVVKIEGRKITMIDPDLIDWRDLANINIQADLVRVALSREDRNFLQGLSMPTWKFNKLMESYYVHYGLEEKIREAKRKAQFGL